MDLAGQEELDMNSNCGFNELVCSVCSEEASTAK